MEKFPLLLTLLLFLFSDPFHPMHRSDCTDPECTDLETLRVKMEAMAGPCGTGSGNVNQKTGTGSRSNRSRRGSSRQTADSVDYVDGSSKEKTVNFANCVSPPSSGTGLNNESYPCDCCQLDESQFMSTTSSRGRSLNNMPCGPSLMQFSEVSF